MSRKVTIKDIARELNTTISTVSRALNDSPLISIQTKALVKKKAAEMGYRPNSIARQLRDGRSRTLGLLVPRINRAFFANVIHGVESIAKQEGYQLLICQSNDSVEEEEEAIKTLREQKVAGIIVSRASDAIHDDFYQEILDDGIPLVMFDRVARSLNVNQVINANESGSYLAVKHLIQQGYQKILHFGGPLSINVYQERYAGYVKALAEAQIPLDESLVFRTVLTQEEGQKCMKQILERALSFDAIAAASDFSALGAYLELEQAGFLIPDQVGLVGFANESFTELIGMSSVEQYSVDMGMTSAKLLLEEIEGREKDAPQMHRQMVIVPKLVVRKSTQKGNKKR